MRSLNRIFDIFEQKDLYFATVWNMSVRKQRDVNSKSSSPFLSNCAFRNFFEKREKWEN